MLQKLSRADFREFELIHTELKELFTKHKYVEWEIISRLAVVEYRKLFLTRGYRSLYEYTLKEFALSEDLTYTFIKLSRKSREVPQLKDYLCSGKITSSKAIKIATVLNEANADRLLTFAVKASKRAIEKEVSKLNPQAAHPDRTKEVAPNLTRLELYVSNIDDIRRAQDVAAQKRRENLSLSTLMELMTGEYLWHNDPFEKAKRSAVRASKKSDKDKKDGKTPPSNLQDTDNTDEMIILPGPGRVNLPVHAKNQVQLRTGGRCTFKRNGERCEERRWLHIHHIKPVAMGGANDIENLTMLCSAHHDLVHQLEFPGVLGESALFEWTIGET